MSGANEIGWVANASGPTSWHARIHSEGRTCPVCDRPPPADPPLDDENGRS